MTGPNPLKILSLDNISREYAQDLVSCTRSDADILRRWEAALFSDLEEGGFAVLGRFVIRAQR